MTITEDEIEHEKNKTVQVLFNKKRITLQMRKYTGLEIKQEAIREGINIQLSYVLKRVKHNGARVIIGDHDTVQVNAESEFLAVADDDNS